MLQKVEEQIKKILDKIDKTEDPIKLQQLAQTVESLVLSHNRLK